MKFAHTLALSLLAATVSAQTDEYGLPDELTLIEEEELLDEVLEEMAPEEAVDFMIEELETIEEGIEREE